MNQDPYRRSPSIGRHSKGNSESPKPIGSLVLLVTLIAALSTAGRAQVQTAYTIPGSQYSDYLGRQMMNAGDVDGDGCDDLLVTTGGLASNQQEWLRVYSGVDGSLLYSVIDASNQNGFGFSIAALDDLDGDGVNDFAAGTPWNDTAFMNAGRVSFYSGATGALISNVMGSAAQDVLGTSLASIGDLDGDGRRDLIVGVPGSDVAGPDFGEVRVYASATSSVLFTLYGASTSKFGNSVGSLEDVDGDGLDEIVVGNPDEKVGPFTNAGALHVYSGLTGALLFSVSGTATDEHFGARIISCGDCNGDGLDDIIVGERYANQGVGVFNNGRLLCISGFDGSLIRTIWGSQTDEALGLSLAPMTDFDGDGETDFLAGHNGHRDPNGSFSTGGLRLYSSRDFAALVDCLGDFYGDYLGTSAASGDFNGDGLPDFAVGAIRAPAGGNFGSIRVFSGQPRTSTSIGGGQPNSPAAQLLVHGFETGTAKGPFSSTVNRGENFVLDIEGAPNMLVTLYWSHVLNPGGWLFPGFGNFDLGTGPFFTDVQIVFDGFAGGFPYFGTNSAGRLQTSYYIAPGWPTGPFVNIQALVQHEQPWFTWATISAAHQLVVQ